MQEISEVCPFYDDGKIIANKEYCRAYDKFLDKSICADCYISCQKCTVTTKSEFYFNGEVLCSKCYLGELDKLEQGLFLETLTVQEEIKRVKGKMNG